MWGSPDLFKNAEGGASLVYSEADSLLDFIILPTELH